MTCIPLGNLEASARPAAGANNTDATAMLRPTLSNSATPRFPSIALEATVTPPTTSSLPTNAVATGCARTNAGAASLTTAAARPRAEATRGARVRIASAAGILERPAISAPYGPKLFKTVTIAPLVASGFESSRNASPMFCAPIRTLVEN